MKMPCLLALCLSVSACAPPPSALVAAADPARIGPAPAAARVASGGRAYGPVEPDDWLKTNQGVAPAAPRGQP